MGDLTPSVREARARLEELDPDVRDHIIHEVKNGRELREREWARLGIVVARVIRRELITTIIIAPILVFLVLLVGTVAGRWSRGEDPWATALLVVTWHGGLPWVGIAIALTGLLLLATRRYRTRLRRAQRLNRRRALDG